jgi:hypothetical protein
MILFIVLYYIKNIIKCLFKFRSINEKKFVLKFAKELKGLII